MGRANATVDELKSYFKTHSKIREQKAHTSKVFCNGIQNKFFNKNFFKTGTFGRMELRW